MNDEDTLMLKFAAVKIQVKTWDSMIFPVIVVWMHNTFTNYLGIQ